MDASYYFFSLFIFILICILLIVYKKLNIKNDKQYSNHDQIINNKEKEDRTFRIFQEFEEAIDNFEEFMDKTKTDIINDRKNLEDLYGRINLLLNDVSNKLDANQKEPVISNQKKSIKTNDKNQKIDADLTNVNSNDKNSKVIELYKKGVNLDVIAQQLDMSKGEISLIVNLYKKKL